VYLLKYGWLVKAVIRLQLGGLGPTTIRADKALFDTALSREVAQRQTEPAVFVGGIHQTHEAEHGLLVSCII
jgi:hypothetical protein